MVCWIRKVSLDPPGFDGSASFGGGVVQMDFFGMRYLKVKHSQLRCRSKETMLDNKHVFAVLVCLAG